MADDLGVWRFNVALQGESKLYKCDVIEHEAEKWLVPYWWHSKDEEWSEPARIVRLAAFRHQWHLGKAIGDGTVNEPIPKHLMDHTVALTQADAATAMDRPPLRRIVRRRLN